MSKKTWKNMTLRSGKLAWRSAVFVLTIGAILAAKALKLFANGAAMANEEHRASDSVAFPFESDYILDPVAAEAAFLEGKIGPGEYGLYVDPYQDGLGQ